MTLKINKIQNAGILRLDNDIELGKYSLFYGYNGSGKTTLSKLFDLLGLPECDRKKNLINDITNVGDIVFKANNKNYNDSTNEFIDNIKVFNKDFIEREVFSPKGMKIILGKPNADVQKKLNELEGLKNGIDKLNEGFNQNKQIFVNDVPYTGIESLDKEKQKIERDIDNLFITYARSIKEKFGGYFVNYDKAKLKAIAREVSINIDEVKKENGYDSNWTDVFTIAKAEMNKLSTDRTIPTDGFDKIDTLKTNIPTPELFKLINDFLTESVTIPDEEIKSITSHDIKNWIKDGITHHNDKTKCYFCSSDLGVSRLDKLRNAFSGKYEKLAIALKDKKNILDNAKKSIQSFKPVEYDEIKNDIDNTSIVGLIDKFLQQIQTKLHALEVSVENVVIDNEIENYQKSLVNLLTKYQNFNKTQTDKSKEYKKIEKWLAIAFLEGKSDKSYTTLKQKELQITNKLKEVYLENADKIKEKLKNTQDKLKSEGIDVVLNEVSDINIEITSTTQSIANVDLAIDEIKKHFFNIIDANIDIQYNEDDKSFVIKRGGKEAAKTLSEGEKTALAFSYFLTTFDKNNGIPLSQLDEKKRSIVIDDPISSLDYNVLYGIYNKIYHYIYKIKCDDNTSRLRDFKNIVILTHNFYFANLIIKGFGLDKRTNAVYEIRRMQKEIEKVGDDKIIKNIESTIKSFENFDYFANEYDYLLDYIIKSYKELPEKGTAIFNTYSLGNACRRLIELYCKFNTNNKIDDLALFKNQNNGLLRFLHLSSHGEIMQDKNSLHHEVLEIKQFVKTILTGLDSKKIKEKCKEKIIFL